MHQFAVAFIGGKARKLTEEQIFALGVLVRHHLIKTAKTIKTVKGSADGKRTQAQAELLNLCEILPFERKNKDGTVSYEYSRTFTRLLQGTPDNGDEDKIASAFMHKILTAEYCSNLPSCVIHAIKEIFPETATKGFIRSRIETAPAKTSPLLFSSRFAIYDQSRIKEIADYYEGLWQVIRYSHRGNRVVRLALEIKRPSIDNTHPFPVFTTYFRDSILTKNDLDPYISDGCIVPLRHERHKMFLGAEDTGFPLIITSRIRLPPKGAPLDSCSGSVHPHHQDTDVMFSIPAQFLRVKPQVPIEEYPKDKLGSWAEDVAIKKFQPDTGDIETILENLREPLLNEGRGGLIVGGNRWS